MQTTHPLLPLYVVVLNWNLPEETLACIASIHVAGQPGIEIVVVDNGSTDTSVATFREHYGESIAIVENRANLGFAAGVNAGIRHALAAGAHSILLLNNDTVVDSSMINELLWAATCLPDAGVLGPIIYYYDQPDNIWRFADDEYRWLPFPLRLPDSTIARTGGRPFKADYVTACGVLVKREVFETAGLFDERYFLYFEDADFCRRVHAAGYEIWCVPNARMWHKVSLSARKDKPLNRYAAAWGRAQFFRDHPHGPSRRLTLLYLLLKISLTTTRDVLARDWNLIPPLWLGTFDGYCSRPPRHRRFAKKLPA